MKEYTSKIGYELAIPLVVLFCFGIYKSILDKKWVAMIVIIITLIFLWYLFSTIRYKIEDSKLKIGSNLNIDITTIWKISETYNLIAAPAASIDRLEIFYNKSESVLISPKDKKEFINSLLKINPDIKVEYRKKNKNFTYGN